MTEQELKPGNLKQQDALKFMLGGNALFTVKDIVTEKRFTYKVLVDSKNEDQLKVFVMNGTDNTKNYWHFGHIVFDSGMPVFRVYSIHNRDKEYTKWFERILLNLSIERVMPQIEMWHEGRCCRCGRVLTVPESIASGIGPECAFMDARVNRGL